MAPTSQAKGKEVVERPRHSCEWHLAAMISPRAPPPRPGGAGSKQCSGSDESLTSLPREENLRVNLGMTTFIAQHAHEILGILSCSDRVVIHRHAPRHLPCRRHGWVPVEPRDSPVRPSRCRPPRRPPSLGRAPGTMAEICVAEMSGG